MGVCNAHTASCRERCMNGSSHARVGRELRACVCVCVCRCMCVCVCVCVCRCVSVRLNLSVLYFF